MFGDFGNLEGEAPNLREDDTDTRDPIRNHYNFMIDLDSLINEVYLIPGAGEWFVETVEAVITDSELELTEDDVYNSDMDQEPWY